MCDYIGAVSGIYEVLKSADGYVGVQEEDGRRVSVVACGIFFFQAEDGIRDSVASRGLGDVYRDRFTPESRLGHPITWV